MAKKPVRVLRSGEHSGLKYAGAIVGFFVGGFGGLMAMLYWGRRRGYGSSRSTRTAGKRNWTLIMIVTIGAAIAGAVGGYMKRSSMGDDNWGDWVS